MYDSASMGLKFYKDNGSRSGGSGEVTSTTVVQKEVLMKEQDRPRKEVTEKVDGIVNCSKPVARI